jgi:hypothetical protein
LNEDAEENVEKVLTLSHQSKLFISQTTLRSFGSAFFVAQNGGFLSSILGLSYKIVFLTIISGSYFVINICLFRLNKRTTIRIGFFRQIKDGS